MDVLSVTELGREDDERLLLNAAELVETPIVVLPDDDMVLLFVGVGVTSIFVVLGSMALLV